MDSLELICHRARMEAKGFRSDLDVSESDDSIPYFIISKLSDSARLTSKSRYDVCGYNFEGHDNAPRMDYICDFLRTAVLPYIDINIDVSGCYNIELHDSYSYRPNRDAYKNCLTFSRDRDHTHMTLLPNPYQLGNYANGQFNDLSADKVPWDKKSDVMFFAGSTTGSLDPLSNARIAACQWSLKHPDASKFRLTNVVQMTPEEFHAKVPNGNDLMCPMFPVQENFNYKYLVNIAGNTCAWSRIPMIMSSKSLLMHMYHRDIEWFYPMMIEDTHFMGCAFHTLLSKRHFAMSNPQVVQFMIANANKFSAAFLGRNQAILYTVGLLEAISQQNKA
jgi:Glycosyl transferase family 90